MLNQMFIFGDWFTVKQIAQFLADEQADGEGEQQQYDDFLHVDLLFVHEFGQSQQAFQVAVSFFDFHLCKERMKKDS